MGRKRVRSGKPVLFADLAAHGVRRVSVLAEAVIVGRLAGRWSDIVGGKLADKTRPARLRRKCLTINVENSPLLHELDFLRDDLLSKVKENAPDAGVERINFKIGKIS